VQQSNVDSTWLSGDFVVFCLAHIAEFSLFSTWTGPGGKPISYLDEATQAATTVEVGWSGRLCMCTAQTAQHKLFVLLLV
jgi:hypothetical protein